MRPNLLAFRSILVFLVGFGLGTGCGGTSVGNPLVTIESKPYSTSITALLDPRAFLASSMPTLTAVTEFKFCNTQFQVKTSGESDSVEEILGVVDVSDSTATTSWGEVRLANEGTQVEELSFELHRDPEKCSGAEYSVRFNGSEITKDLEFKFVFSPPVAISEGSRVRLGLDAIATAIQGAYDAGDFTNEKIANYLTTETKGTAEEVED